MTGLSLRLALECTVCLKERDDQEAKDVTLLAALCGARRWAQCPACLQRADPSDASYRVRARAYTGTLTYVEDGAGS